MSRDIIDGKWFEITSQFDFDEILQYGDLGRDSSWMSARVQKGKFVGSGKYMLLKYTQPCPKHCCRDKVHELLTQEEVASELKSKIDELTEILAEAES